MTRLSTSSLKWPRSMAFPGFCIAFMLVFLQVGLSYYISFQMLALIVVLTIAYRSRIVVVNKAALFFIHGLLLFSIAITEHYSPMVISRNSINYLYTIIGIMLYAFLIMAIVHLRPKKIGRILLVFRFASAATICALSVLLVLTHLELTPLLDRKAMLMQNSSLVTNYSDEEMLERNLERQDIPGYEIRPDLFYGEASYLGVVLFACLGSFMLTSKLISEYMNGIRSVVLESSSHGKYGRYVVIVGILSLLSLSSLSSIVYAMVLLFHGSVAIIKRYLSFSKLFPYIACLAVFLFAYPDILQYFFFRITMEDSVSLAQRFGSLLNFDASDYLFGVKDESKLPEEGFHNGLFYIIAISGLAGILYTILILRAVHRLAKPIKMSGLLTLIVLALIMQNGAVFSPNKVVLFALILLPLSCVRTVYARDSSRIPVRVSSD